MNVKFFLSREAEIKSRLLVGILESIIKVGSFESIIVIGSFESALTQLSILGEHRRISSTPLR